MKRIISLLFVILSSMGIACSQDNNKVEITQPRIMVFPWVKSGEDRKAAFDASSDIRIAIAKINEAFQKRGANLADFDAFIQNVDENKLLNKSSGNQQDLNTLVLGSAAADIYVGTEIIVTQHTDLNARSVTVIMNAYQPGVAKSLASKTGFGRTNRSPDIGMHVAQAIDTVIVDFLNTIQQSLGKIKAEGQSVNIEFSLDGNSALTFDSEIGTDAQFLSQVIKGWIKKNAVNARYNFQGAVGKKMIFSDVRLPLIDPTEGDEPYTGDNIFRDISKYLKQKGIKVRREISTNNKLLITIL